MKKAKVTKLELLQWNKYMVKLSCGHWFINDTSVTKIKDMSQFINCMKCKE